MKRLPSDFTYQRYGLTVRFIQESDAEFILSLRTNPKLARYIHATSEDTTKQIEWTREYKKREQAGLDYYFIYSCENQYVGVNRIYDITADYGTGGSWICLPNTDTEVSVATLLIMRDIMFEELDLLYDKFDVRKGNKQVQRIHKMMGARIVAEPNIDYFFELSRDEYFTNRDNIIDLLNLKK